MTTRFLLHELNGAQTGQYRLDTAQGSSSPATGLPVVQVKGGAALGQVSDPAGHAELWAKRLGAGGATSGTPVRLVAVGTPSAPATPATQEQVAELIQTALDDLPDPGTSVASDSWSGWTATSLANPSAGFNDEVYGPLNEDVSFGDSIALNEDGDLVIQPGVYVFSLNTSYNNGNGTTRCRPALNLSAFPDGWGRDAANPWQLASGMGLVMTIPIREETVVRLGVGYAVAVGNETGTQVYVDIVRLG